MLPLLLNGAPQVYKEQQRSSSKQFKSGQPKRLFNRVEVKLKVVRATC